MTAVLQHPVGAAHHCETGFLQQVADDRRVVDGLPDVFFKTAFAIFKYTDL